MAWNRSPAPVAELVEAGARPAASPGEAVGAPVSFSMRADDIATDPIRPVNTSRTAPAGACRPCVHHSCSRRQGRLHLAETVAHEVHLKLPTAPTIRRMFEEALADPALHGSDWSAITEVRRCTPALRNGRPTGSTSRPAYSSRSPLGARDVQPRCLSLMRIPLFTWTPATRSVSMSVPSKIT
ncbi:hypothetical protein ACWCQN_38850 [Streptomyces sp. NPDC001984]